MRWLIFLLYGLAGTLAAVWILFYIWVQELGCAWGSPPGGCGVRAPWNLEPKVFLSLFLIPLCIILVLAGLGRLLQIRARR